MNISRRSFLRLSAFGGSAVAAGGCGTLFTGAKSDYDPNLTVFLSDVHVRGGKSYQLEQFKAIVAEILKLNPLPKHAVICGDLAFLYGRKEDYETSAPYLKQLSDAGIAVTIGMGNHDRRSTFFEVHPEYLKRTKVPGYVVTVTDVGHADVLMLDSLAGSDTRGNSAMGPGAGVLCDAQQEWLAAELPKWKRPVFVCAHHPYHELKVNGRPLIGLLEESPAVAGYIYGHIHRWGKGWSMYGWKNKNIAQWLSLPSTGHWGDIGYALMRTSPKGAEVALRQKDFFFPHPLDEGEKRPEIWDAIIEENRGDKALFRFA